MPSPFNVAKLIKSSSTLWISQQNFGGPWRYEDVDREGSFQVERINKPHSPLAKIHFMTIFFEFSYVAILEIRNRPRAVL